MLTTNEQKPVENRPDQQHEPAKKRPGHTPPNLLDLNSLFNGQLFFGR